MTEQQKDKLLIETAEQIVIDYANLSGRESAHRAEFRKLVIEKLTSLLTQHEEELVKRVEEMEVEGATGVTAKFNYDPEWYNGYNRAITDYINKLKELL